MNLKIQILNLYYLDNYIHEFFNNLDLDINSYVI